MIIKPRSRIIQDLDAKSFTVLGSPASDGLGAGALQTFHAGLSGAEGDFIVVLGDVSPLGRDPYYSEVADFIDASTQKPVYVMRGNHDGPDYPEYFGMENRAVVTEEYLLIMLDNSSRRFTDGTLAFLSETMALIESMNVLIAFHVPPPNRFTGHSMSRKEWQRFEDAVGVWRSRISLLLCSHAHHGFEDDIDGLRLVVTGGAGARMHQGERLAAQTHHALEITPGDKGKPKIAMRRLSLPENAAVESDADDALKREYAERCRARVELAFRAEEAEARGEQNLARLYRAGAESSLLQARSLYGLAAGGGVPAALTMDRVEEAKESFVQLLGRAADGDADAPKYFVCRSCGFVSSGSEGATYCSACGAPGSFIEETE
jgi:rubrerythrin